MKTLLMVIVLGLGFPVVAHADFLDDYALYSADVWGNHYAEQRYYRQREIDRLFEHRERAVVPNVVIPARRGPIRCFTNWIGSTAYTTCR